MSQPNLYKNTTDIL